METSGPRKSLDTLPFDVLTLIIPHLGLFDLARLRLVSRSFYHTFTSDEVCRFALTRLVPRTPEACEPTPTSESLTKLIARSARWMGKRPTGVERVPIAKSCADPRRQAWGVAGDLLVYQS